MPKEKQEKPPRFEDPSKDTLAIVSMIRKKYYPEYKKARIITKMRNGKWSKYGTIRAVSDEQKETGVEADYILMLSKPAFDAFTTKQRKALIHHELEHMIVKKTKNGVVYRCRHHDIEEFNNIVKIYGEWLPSVSKFRKALQEGRK